MSFQASCPACAAPVEFDVANSVVTICPSCSSAVGRADGKLKNLGKVADLVQTDQVFAWTLTLIVMMAAIEMGILRPLENHLFRWRKEVENA